MEPKYWANGTWFMIFVIIFEYFNDVETMKKLLLYVCDSLPCIKCREHIKINLQNNNIMSETNSMRVLHFFIELRNEFQRIKVYTGPNAKDKSNFIIDRTKITGTNLTLKHKALILKAFCYDFQNKISNNDLTELNNIKKIIDDALLD